MGGGVDAQPCADLFEPRVRAAVAGQLRLQALGDAPGEQRGLGLVGQGAQALKALIGRQRQPGERQGLALRREQNGGRGAIQVVEGTGFAGRHGSKVEGRDRVAESQHGAAQRKQRQVEGGGKILGQVGLGDLQPMRLQVVDQRLAEAAALGGLGSGIGAGGVDAIGLDGAVGRVDHALEHPKQAIGTDGDQATGAAAIRFGESRAGGQGSANLLLPGRDIFGLGLVIGAPVFGGDVRQVVLALGKVVQDRAEVGRWLGRRGLDPAVVGGDAKGGVEYRPGPFPVGGQRRGFGFELCLGEAADQGRVVHEALVVVAEQVPGDGAASRFIGFDADETTEA